MIARPSFTSLGCSSCRNVIFKAVAVRPPPTFRTIQQGSYRRFPRSTARFFSTERNIESSLPATQTSQTLEKVQETSENCIEDGHSTGQKPWFLEVEPPSHPPSLHTPTLPEAPTESPALVTPMIKYIFEDMGLDDISLMDLRDLDPPAALGPNLIMLFATARSERHLHVSSGRFVRWLRRNYKVNARADGLIGPGELKTKLRRLRKKAKLMGTNTMILPGGDNGISTGWVCVNFSTSDAVTDETASFDESGRFSGFGAAATGTTIVVQCMTESRRNELDLETLWQAILKRNLEQTMKIKGQTFDSQKDLESLVSSKLQLPKTESATQWQKMQQASQQQRRFSTYARRLQPGIDAMRPAMETMAEDTIYPEATESELAMLQRHITDLQISGTSMSMEILERLIFAVFQASSAKDGSITRLQLVDQLLLTAEERGMSVHSKNVLVTLIEAIVASPAYNFELERAQKNLEFLLLDQQTPLDHDQTSRLMTAYAERQDWDRFWDTFRAPARFCVARPAELYELVYRVMVSTQDSKMCIDALRWVYPEMLKEQPAVYPTGPVYNALKACILIADPAAEELLHNPPPLDSLDTIGRRRLRRREFVRVLKEVEDVNRHLVENQAREERAQALNRFYDAADVTN
ncbi:hypothetical protein C2857_004146 [Epichloe festucae Fl1]|uniref:ATPase synthesis protein 25 n=1 Tax=Epichloe festucae (strain Fl1) TaxID=877507 RepID=A0A7U3SNS0_EPIFF|nr:hypothetical protein C2857_004146 [Epichloe festucae Fl1]